MIQFREILKRDEPIEKEVEQLGALLNFLDEQKIEYDLEPPRVFDGWETLPNGSQILKLKPIA